MCSKKEKISKNIIHLKAVKNFSIALYEISLVDLCVKMSADRLKIDNYQTQIYKR